MIFVDAGAFVARYRRSDANHAAAVAAWSRLEHGSTRLVTCNLVIAEAATILTRYVGPLPAAQRTRAILASGEFLIMRPTPEDDIDATEVMEKYADHPIGFVDCLSFVLMKQKRITQFFGFDKHFEVAGFERWPRRR